MIDINDPGPGDVVAGAVAPELVAELGELELWTASARVARTAYDAGRARLDRLSAGFHVGELVRERAGRLLHPAYTVLERQVGLDPSEPSTALERHAREAVVAGRLVPTDPCEDVRLAILAEAGVPLGALDARRTRGPWALRTAVAGERLAPRDPELRPGALIVADADGAVAPMFGDPPRRRAARRARTVVFYAVRVPGLPSWEVSEAVWRASRYLSDA